MTRKELEQDILSDAQDLMNAIKSLEALRKDPPPLESTIEVLLFYKSDILHLEAAIKNAEAHLSWSLSELNKFEFHKTTKKGKKKK